MKPQHSKPRIIMDHCIGCDRFTEVARHGHMDRGICSRCLGSLLKAFDLTVETMQLQLWKSACRVCR
jgi:hypothetical protein